MNGEGIEWWDKWNKTEEYYIKYKYRLKEDNII